MKKYLFFVIAGITLIIGFVLISIDLVLNNPISSRNMLNPETTNRIYLEKGKYGLFYEYDTNKKNIGIVEIKKSFELTPDLLTVKITAVEGQEEVAVRENQSMTFTINRIQGKSLFSFNLDESGTYNIVLDLKQEDLASEIHFSIVDKFTDLILSGFKRVAVLVLVSLLFVMIGLYMYLRERGATKEK